MGKKIIIISHSLEVGGAERSLIGLLSSLNPKKVEIDLFLLRHEGRTVFANSSICKYYTRSACIYSLSTSNEKNVQRRPLLINVCKTLGKNYGMVIR